jgi:hypothetical protein
MRARATILLFCVGCRVDVAGLVCPTCRQRVPCPRCGDRMLFDSIEGYNCFACGWETFLGAGGAWNEGQGVDWHTPQRVEGQIHPSRIPKGFETRLDK